MRADASQIQVDPAPAMPTDLALNDQITFTYRVSMTVAAIVALDEDTFMTQWMGLADVRGRDLYRAVQSQVSRGGGE